METSDKSKVVFPPTQNVLRAAELLNEAVERVLNGYAKIAPGWKYEADFEARTLMWLVIRNTEGVSELAKSDMVLFPAALSACRSAFEIAIRALWLLQPNDPFDREARWLAQLATQENHYERLGKKLTEMGCDASIHRKFAKSVREFRLGVTSVLPAGYKAVAQPPHLEDMMKNLNLRHLYSHYMNLSQFAHGTHVAGRLYRKGLGAREGGGENVRSCDWRYPLEICFFAVTNIGKRLTEICGVNLRPFLTDAFCHKFQVAIKRVKDEKVQWIDSR